MSQNYPLLKKVIVVRNGRDKPLPMPCTWSTTHGAPQDSPRFPKIPQDSPFGRGAATWRPWAPGGPGPLCFLFLFFSSPRHLQIAGSPTDREEKPARPRRCVIKFPRGETLEKAKGASRLYFHAHHGSMLASSIKRQSVERGANVCSL